MTNRTIAFRENLFPNRETINREGSETELPQQGRVRYSWIPSRTNYRTNVNPQQLINFYRSRPTSQLDSQSLIDNIKSVGPGGIMNVNTQHSQNLRINSTSKRIDVDVIG